MATEKIAELGIERDVDFMYYVKKGDLWAVRRKKPGQRHEPAMMIARAGVEMDYSKYLYYLDADGDIARKERFVPRPRKKARKKKAARKKPTRKKAKVTRKKKATTRTSRRPM